MRIVVIILGLGLIALGIWHCAGGLVVAGVFTMAMTAHLGRV